MRSISSAAVGLLCSLLAPGSVEAIPVQVDFRATVYAVPDPTGNNQRMADWGAVQVGSDIVGSYRFDSARDDSGTPDVGIYEETLPPHGLEFTIGNDTFRSKKLPPNTTFGSYLLRTRVLDHNGGFGVPSPEDVLAVTATVPDLNGSILTAVLFFRDPSATALTGTTLPALAPNLRAFPIAEFWLPDWSGLSGAAVRARITSTIQVVPEPGAAIWLLGSAALAWAHNGRGQLRRM